MHWLPVALRVSVSPGQVLGCGRAWWVTGPAHWPVDSSRYLKNGAKVLFQLAIWPGRKPRSDLSVQPVALPRCHVHVARKGVEQIYVLLRVVADLPVEMPDRGDGEQPAALDGLALVGKFTGLQADGARWNPVACPYSVAADATATAMASIAAPRYLRSSKHQKTRSTVTSATGFDAPKAATGPRMLPRARDPPFWPNPNQPRCIKFATAVSTAVGWLARKNSSPSTATVSTHTATMTMAVRPKRAGISCCSARR